MKNITVSMNMCIVRKRVAVFHGGFMTGLHFLLRIVYKKVRDWTAGHSLLLLPNEILLRSPPQTPRPSRDIKQAIVSRIDKKTWMVVFSSSD